MICVNEKNCIFQWSRFCNVRSQSCSCSVLSCLSIRQTNRHKLHDVCMSLVITISFTQYLVLFHSSEIWYYASYQILTKCNLRAYLILFIATFDSMKSAIDRYNKSKMEHHHLVNPTSEVKVYSQQLFSNFCFLCMYTAQPVSDCSTIMDLCFKKIYAIITSGGRLMCYSFVKYRNLKC